MPHIDPTAAQSPITHFYHYQSYCKKYFTDMLRDQMLHFSHPHNVNDPWDCKPWFDCQPMIEDPEKREAMIAFFNRELPPETLNDPRRPHFENQLRTDDEMMRKRMAESSTILATELSTLRIYCLTPFADNTLMWSHYANDHKGICLEFANNNFFIRHARAVRYEKNYPVWTPQSYGPGKDANILDLILTKAMDWCYEREWRIIASAREGPTKLHNHDFVSLPLGALSAIIIGCENKDHSEIIEIVKAHQPGLTIKWAVRIPNVYKLTISDKPDFDGA
jgi:DUF2971 family protein